MAVEVRLAPSARMTHHAHSEEWQTTVEDFPPSSAKLYAVPRVGETIWDDESGRSWQVHSVSYPLGGGNPLVEVE